MFLKREEERGREGGRGEERRGEEREKRMMNHDLILLISGNTRLQICITSLLENINIYV